MIARDGEKGHAPPEICANLIDVRGLDESYDQDIIVEDVVHEDSIEQQELYCKVKEDSNLQDRSEDTNQSARSGSTFSLPGSRQQQSFLTSSNEGGPSRPGTFLSFAWRRRP